MPGIGTNLGIMISPTSGSADADIATGNNFEYLNGGNILFLNGGFFLLLTPP